MDSPSPDSNSNSHNPAKVVEDFQFLLEKSQQLFASLKDLPLTANQKIWYPYFQKTFEIFTRLWRFQQLNRKVLESKDYYGLKRYEIGEIASKIGQLYYHYYLRTSETNYLQEAYIFYEAIRERAYFADVIAKTKNPSLMVKKLRYYARHIVVCLLLNRKDLVKKLTDELHTLTEEYIVTFQPSDAHEWRIVSQEIVTFLDSDKRLPIDFRGALLPVPSRLQMERSLRYDKDGTTKLRLSEAILVGNCQTQTKFSELTLDVFRMLQSLEREPVGNKVFMESASNLSSGPSTEVAEELSSTSANTNDAASKTTRRTNPHKYLLYRPTFSQLFLYLTSAFKDINENMACLLYLSAEGHVRHGTDISPLFGGGVLTITRREQTEGVIPNCLHPADLIPFSRRPLFVIVDSPASTVYREFPNVFGQPICFLMSPTKYPSAIRDRPCGGNIFTLFLHSPLLGFCMVSEVTQVENEVWSKCLSMIGMWETLIADTIMNNELVDKSFKRFLQDDFLRQFTVRFIIARIILQTHNLFNDIENLPTCLPNLPEGLLRAPEVASGVKELALMLNVDRLYKCGETTEAEIETGKA